ncbi:MAG: hypothetical protein DMF61_19975 [Blastocatellia bacterium AA13]|nr:MAG: hypothetical protein DMF61_19975 [Blastocatellia bacterium AA13]
MLRARDGKEFYDTVDSAAVNSISQESIIGTRNGPGSLRSDLPSPFKRRRLNDSLPATGAYLIDGNRTD